MDHSHRANPSKFTGIDLFAGAGGLTVGASAAGINVVAAVEADPWACQTYKSNNPGTDLFEGDITRFEPKRVADLMDGPPSVIFGGPPCRGFSTSNQRTRNAANPGNWLFEEFLRVTEALGSPWVVFENVKGIVETEDGKFLEEVLKRLDANGYSCKVAILNAADFSVPQRRNRMFIVGSLESRDFSFPDALPGFSVTVDQAIGDLPVLENGASEDELDYARPAMHPYAVRLRAGAERCRGNLVSRNAPYVLSRYTYVPQGGNWSNIPEELMKNYADRNRCHTGIYHRLRGDEPSVVIGNYRKNMLIHPLQDRGLSVREAARLQSFPDNYVFSGSIGFQQQQVGNAVPPLLAEAIFSSLIRCASRHILHTNDTNVEHIAA